MSLPDVSQNPLLTWVALIGAAVIVLGVVADKGLTPIGKWWYGLQETRREAEAAREDADLRELRRIAANLEASNVKLAGRISGLEQREDRHTQVLQVHAAWDFQVQQELMRAGIDVPKPPPLRPYID